MKRVTFYIVLILALSACLSKVYGKTTQQIPTMPAHWKEVYNGYGAISYHVTHGIVMQPARAIKAKETHATLALIRQTVAHPQKDFTLQLTVTTEQQLRSTAPNPWEVFWLFFNYQDIAGNIKTNYFLLKPNGIELGIAFEGRKQAFLYTSTVPVLKLGFPQTWVVTKKGTHLIVFIDGVKVMTFSGKMIDRPGAIGIYTEDAKVRVQNVLLSS